MNSSRVPIHNKTRLAVTLRWLAYLDLCFAWSVGISTFFADNGVLWPTLQAIDAAFPLGFPFDDPEALENLLQGFSNHLGGILDGCVMAMDGFGVLTCAPYETEVVQPKDYRYRKSGFAIIVLAGCDASGLQWSLSFVSRASLGLLGVPLLISLVKNETMPVVLLYLL